MPYIIHKNKYIAIPIYHSGMPEQDNQAYRFLKWTQYCSDAKALFSSSKTSGIELQMAEWLPNKRETLWPD